MLLGQRQTLVCVEFRDFGLGRPHADRPEDVGWQATGDLVIVKELEVEVERRVRREDGLDGGRRPRVPLDLLLRATVVLRGLHGSLRTVSLKSAIVSLSQSDFTAAIILAWTHHSLSPVSFCQKRRLFVWDLYLLSDFVLELSLPGRARRLGLGLSFAFRLLSLSFT